MFLQSTNLDLILQIDQVIIYLIQGKKFTELSYLFVIISYYPRFIHFFFKSNTKTYLISCTENCIYIDNEKCETSLVTGSKPVPLFYSYNLAGLTSENMKIDFYQERKITAYAQI